MNTLNLTVAYQNSNRLSVYIRPIESSLDSKNTSWFILPDTLVPRPGSNSNASMQSSDLQFAWSNNPTFSFSVTRKSTGDVLFNTTGTKLVFENQFVEFVTTMPNNYNVYGLGERIHGFRLGNNFTATIYAADAGDPIDQNIYGSHVSFCGQDYSLRRYLTFVPAGIRGHAVLRGGFEWVKNACHQQSDQPKCDIPVLFAWSIPPKCTWAGDSNAGAEYHVEDHWWLN